MRERRDAGHARTLCARRAAARGRRARGGDDDGRERDAASLFEYVHMILAAACDVYRDIARRRPGDVYRAWHVAGEVP